MAHNVNNDATKPTVIGAPLYDLKGDDLQIVEGELGNPVFLNDDDIFLDNTPTAYGKDFYILVAAEKGKSAGEVAGTLAKKHRLSVHSFSQPGLSSNIQANNFFLKVDPANSYHYLDHEMDDKLRFRPDNPHLRALYGEGADFYMIAVALPNDRDALFGNDFRIVRDEAGHPTGENINVRKFDLVQESADGVVEAIHRGGLALFDRQDPTGKPDTFHGATLSDLHLSQAANDMEEAVLTTSKKKLDKTSLTIRLNNPDANFVDAIIPWINQEYRAGRLDWVQILGDNVDYAGEHHTLPHSIADSNFNLVAKYLNHIEAPVFVLLGNHDDLPEAFPIGLTAQNFNLKGSEAGKLNGRGFRLDDFVQSIVNNPNTLIPYHDLINPFHDTVVDFGVGNPSEPTSRDVRLVLTDNGGADWAHFRQDDPIYRDLQFWPWNIPYLHGETLIETFFQGSPDVQGPSPEQISWLSSQFAVDSNIILLSHAPLLNSKTGQIPFDPSKPITPLEPAGEYEDLTFNTTAHGSELLQIVADSPNIMLQIGGHAHSDGHAYLMGVDYQDSPQFYRGRIREVLANLHDDNPDDVHHFWHPEDPCTGECTQETETLYGPTAENLRKKKFVWQVGSSTVYNNFGASPPEFSVVDLNPEGFLSDEKHYYITKKIEQDSTNPDRYHLSLGIGETPVHNDDLLKEWEEKKKANPKVALDFTEIQARHDAREKDEMAAYIPNPNSLNDYPRYIDNVEHSYVSPTRLNSQVGAKFYIGSQAKGLDTLGLPMGMGVGVQYMFNQNRGLGTIGRIFIQGLEGGVVKDHKGLEAYAGIQTSPIIDWRIGSNVTLRGLNLTVGPSFHFYPNPAFGVYNQANLFEFQINGLPHGQETGGTFVAGLDRHNLFSGNNGEWFWYGALRYIY